jgi:hypothetical protein
MFIIERRTAGVLAALATTAAMVVAGNVRDPVDEVETPHTATSTLAFATSVGPGVTPIAFGANEIQSGREIPEIPQSE